MPHPTEKLLTVNGFWGRVIFFSGVATAELPSTMLLHTMLGNRSLVNLNKTTELPYKPDGSPSFQTTVKQFLGKYILFQPKIK